LAEDNNGNLLDYSDDDNDDDDDDDEQVNTYPSQDPYSTVDSDSMFSIREQEAPLSLYWFIDEDENNKSPSAIQASNQDKIQSMEIKLQTMEENIKKLLTLLQNQQE